MTTTKSERLYEVLSYVDTLAKMIDDTYRRNAEISEAISEIKAELGIGKIAPDKYDLRGVPTAQLTDELAKREGVTEYSVDSGEGVANISIDEFSERIAGPARIIVTKD